MSNPSLSERIAHLALDTFDSLPQKCRPRILPNGRRQWTPMSAIVLNRPSDSSPKEYEQSQDQKFLKIVSLATGTKSLPVSALGKCNGLILHDCHAEILALRGLSYWLLCEMERILNDDNFKSHWLDMRTTAHHLSSTEAYDTSSNPFSLKPGVDISLFSTTAPCGDASMELLMAAVQTAGQDISPWTSHYTEDIQQQAQQQQISPDSKRLEVKRLPPPGRGYFSELGALRRKPARADAEISLSKSCTDKLMLKQFTGVFGFPADLLIETGVEEAFLKRFVLYLDQYHRVGYQRAFAPNGRLKQALRPEIQAHTIPRFFEVEVLPEQFRRFDFDKVTSVGKNESEKAVTSNLSALWVAEGDEGTNLVEVLINGVKQGYRQFDHRKRKGSAVCRLHMVEKAVNIARLLKARKTIQSTWLEGSLMDTQYSVLKSLPVRQRSREVKELVLNSLGGWPRKTAEDDFTMTSSGSSYQHADPQTYFNISYHLHSPYSLVAVDYLSPFLTKF